MNRRSLWKLSVTTSTEAEEAVAELLGQVLNEPVCSYTDVRAGRASVTAYLEDRKVWTRTERRRLGDGLEQIRACGLNVGVSRVRLTKIRWEDWANSWKRHFRPIEIGGKLLVQPTWSRRPARRGQAVVRLDPGLSFGTGHHPTTAFCLRQLAARRIPGTRQSFLDLGTGSGILAIAAAKLGYGPIDAWEVDADALRIARANARRNGVAQRIRFLRRDTRKHPVRRDRQYALICANLSTDSLLRDRRRIVSGLRSDGILVLAGILEREFVGVKRAYESAGLRLLASRREREWRSGVFHA
jgi:ribosomal protein L11 methyltransferase